MFTRVFFLNNNFFPGLQPLDDAPEIQNYYEDIWHKQQVRHEVMIEHVTSADSQDVEEERRQILIAEERLKYKIDTEGLMEMGKYLDN